MIVELPGDGFVVAFTPRGHSSRASSPLPLGQQRREGLVLHVERVLSDLTGSGSCPWPARADELLREETGPVGGAGALRSRDKHRYEL